MATVYKVEIKLTSPWVNYKEEYIEKIFQDALDKIEMTQESDVFENIEIKVDRVAFTHKQ